MHRKIKHSLEGGHTYSGRGRPRMRQNNSTEPNKPDPTGEAFLRTEIWTGGPTDPVHGFEETVNLLF